MLNNTFLKTLYTKRWMTLAWALGLLLLTVFTMTFFPTFKDIGKSFNDVPDSLRGFLGDSSSYTSIAGFTDLQIISQYVFMTLILGVILFTGLLAGEESSGVLQSLLVQPIKRGRVYLEKLFGGIVILIIVCLSISIGALVGALIVGETLYIPSLLEATLAMLLLTLTFSALAYALGAATGKRGLAGGIAGVLAFVSLLVSTLAESVDSLKAVDKFLPFHYFNKPGILQYGVQWADLLVLAVVSVVIFGVGYVLFQKRDIYQR